MEVSNCIVCKSELIRVIQGYEEYKLVRCKSCSMVFTSDAPSERELIAHYEEYGRDDYRSPITAKRYGEILASFGTNRKSKDILDIGCGIGYFLEEAKKIGWNVFGTEYTDEAYQLCRAKDINMFKGDLTSIDFKDQKFDVITCFEVIEHIQDVKGFIETIAMQLRPYGILYLTTPNFRSFNSRILKQDWNVLCYPEHLSYFSKKSLHRLLNESGFEKKYLKVDGISPERLIRSRKGEKMDHSDSKNKDESMREKIEARPFLQFLKKSLNYILNIFNLGESLKAYYVLKNDDKIHHG